MGLLSQVSNQRRKQIVAYAEPHLSEAEDVLHYVRARDPGSNRKGFAYLTRTRLVVAWKHDGGEAVPLNEIDAWGLKHEGHSPLLRVGSSDRTLDIELRTTSSAMAKGVREFLRAMSELVPPEADDLAADGYARPSDADVGRRPTSAGQLARRIIITVLGVGLIIVGLIITLLPGPWTILLGIAGLAVLATEYDWAEDALDWTRGRYKAARERLRERRRR